MGIPVWNTPSDLGQFFETDNYIKQLSADDTDTYELVIKSNQSLSDPVELIGTKTIIINGTNIQLGSSGSGTIDAIKLFGTNTEATDVLLGRSFVVADLNGEDEITTKIVIDGASPPTFPITGSATFGTTTNNINVNLTGIGNITDLVNTINAATDNTTYGIEAIDNAGTLQLIKANNYGGEDMLIDTSTISGGNLQLTDDTYYLSLTQLVDNINDQLSNTNNVTASVQGGVGSYYMRITDSVTAISLSDKNSNINIELQMPRFSSIARADIASEIDAQSGTTNVNASIVSPNVLELIGGSVLLEAGTGDSNDILGLLHLDSAGSTLLNSPITEWLTVSENLGVLQGTTPQIEITTPILITIRATSSTLDVADRTFNLTLQPLEENSQISWNPGSLGIINEGDVSEFKIEVENFEQISEAASFYVLRPTDFDFSENQLAPWNIERQTTGTYITAGGTIAIASNNEARFEYDYGNNSFLGLLVEPGTSNLLLNSENYIAADWSLSNANLTSGVAMAPDQNYTGTKLYTDNTIATTHYISQSFTSLNDNTDYTYSTFAKADDLDWMALSIILKDGTNSIAYYDLDSGFVGTTSAGVTATIVELKDGWYRCSMTVDIASGGTTPTTIIYLAEADNDNVVNGDDHKGIFIWGSQLESNSLVTSYIPTVAAPVVRASDNITITLYNRDYDIIITSPVAGAVPYTETISTREYTLQSNPGEVHVLSVNIDDYHQKTINGSDTFIITNDGDLSGIPPFHTSPPDSQLYNFKAIVDFKNEILLGINQWSYIVNDIYTSVPIDIHVPSLLLDDDAEEWSQINNNIFDLSKVYKSLDPKFGITSVPRLPIMYGLKDDTLTNYANSIQSNADEFSVIIGELKVINTDNYDVLYYEIVDGGSSTLSYVNPLEINPTTIYPNSIDVIRERLENDITFEVNENLPDWMNNTYIPVIVAGYVEPGEGENVLFRYNQSTANKYFTGRIYNISRMVLTRLDGSEWDSLGSSRTITRLNSRFKAPDSYVDAGNILTP